MAHFAEHRDVPALRTLYQSLITSFIDDSAKYARNSNLKHILKHCLETAPLQAGERIAFAGFGRSHYRSREIGEALRTLERAMLAYLLYPATNWEIPLLADLKRSPRLFFFDTGLLNFAAGLQGHFFEQADLHSFYRGKLAEHIVAQELLASEAESLHKPVFWVREKRQSNAEIDFLVPFQSFAVPFEVKSGASGTLRSLHQYMNLCSHPYAVRLYSGPLEITPSSTPQGKSFQLLNLPYFLAGKWRDYLAWFTNSLGR